MNDPRWLGEARDPGRATLRQALDEEPRFRTSDVRRRRVWARMAAADGARRGVRKAFIAGAVAASALTAVAALALQRLTARKPAPVVVVVAPAPAPAPLPLAPAATIAALPASPPLAAAGALVTAGERTARRLSGGVRVDLQAGAGLFVGDDGRAEVRRGEVRFDVPVRGASPPFVVQVAAYRVIIAGARFSVRLDDRDRISVAVDDGAADVWKRRRVARLGPGQSWSAPRHAPAEEPRALAAASPGRDAGDAPELTAARDAAARDPAAAVALYEQIAARGGSAAENALYEIGALYHDRLHQPERALAAWESYRTRYPHGLLRAEADLSILDTLAAMGRRGRALDDALGFLRRNPGNERRGEVARVGADLARGLGQCRVAAALYAEVAGAYISPDDADDAAFGRAACLAAVDDPRAAAAADAYLAVHPRGRHLAEARRLVESAGRSR